MILDISQLAGDGLVFERELSLPIIAREHPDVVETPTLALSATVQPGPEPRRPEQGARLNGQLRGELRLRCSRCLAELTRERAIRFDLTLVGKAPDPQSPDHQIDARETRFFELEAGKLDLEALAVELVYLDLPAKPICKHDCAGLCPTCGSNRNLLECDCRDQGIDPRLEALQTIRDKMGD
jgi:uncharacterized protein